MSLTKKIGVSSALVFSAILLANAIESRKSLDMKPATIEATLISASKTHKSLSEVKLLVEQRLPGIQITDIELSPLEGFYQAFFAGEMVYISNDAQFIFTGKMLELAESGPIDHSQLALAEQDLKRAPMRAKTIAQIKESDMVVFKAKEEKFVISVFTDVDCAYCRKLHKEVPQLNENGVTVRYLAFPRAGIGSDAYKKLVSVWCADDKTAAMNDAKLKREFGNFGKKSCENPIAEQYNLTRKFNLSGTPALILSDGELIGGYIPATELISHLNNKSNKELETSSGH